MAIKVDYRETLVTYLHCKNVEETAETLKISKAALMCRLTTMRKAGVKVPPATRRHFLDNLGVAQLNSLINKHNAEIQKS